MTVRGVVIAWETFKDWLSDSVHLSHAMLHVHVGMLLFVAALIVLRRPLGAWPPVAIVLVLELLNEGSDFTRYYVSRWPWTPGATVADIVNTLFWPCILTVLARSRLLRRLPAAPVEPADPLPFDGSADRSLRQ